MTTAPEPTPPPYTTEAWRTSSATSWLDQADRLEVMLEPVLDPLFEHAALVAGERVLDVGCGRGATTFRAAREVGGGGAVTGVDVAEQLLEAAAALPLPQNAAPITWLAADAQRADLPRGHFDAVVSRFGVMFFEDPTAAFANLLRATRPGGRMAVATWRPRDASPFQAVGHDAVVAALRANGYEANPFDPAAGPHSFGVDELVHLTLGQAGWTEVVVNSVELPLYFGGPGASPVEAADVALGMAGLSAFLKQYDDRARDLARDAVVEVYSRHHDGTGVRLRAATTVITAVHGPGVDYW